MHLTLTLGVRNLERTAEFYGKTLQLETERFAPTPGEPEFLLLPCGDTAVLFRELAALESRHPALFQNLDRHPLGVGVTLEIPLETLAPVAHNIARQRLHTLYELDDEEFGRRELWLHDPDGYLVILTEETPAP